VVGCGAVVVVVVVRHEEAGIQNNIYSTKYSQIIISKVNLLCLMG
jgi:hypothetical protein